VKTPRVAPEFTLDASAVLALLFEESGAQRVADLLDGAAISAVNLVEVLTVLGRRGASADASMALFDKLKVQVKPWDAELARASANFADLANKGFSMGDRCCITEAFASKTMLVTADKAWKTIPQIADRVILIR
jgi:ribonuclease VapC